MFTAVVIIEDNEHKINIEEGIATAETVNFFNDLFDSVNGDDKKTDNELRCPVMESTDHHEFWVRTKNILRNMSYIDKVSREIVKSVPTLVNWLFTIDGFQKLWQTVHEKYDFNKLNTRYINQDPLENFFGQIRSHSARNINPIPRQFEESFFTLLVSNMKSVSVIGGNCEVYNDDSLLFSLEKHLEANINVHNYDQDEVPELIIEDNVTEESITALLLNSREEIIKSVLKEINNCTDCENNLRNSDFPVYSKQIALIIIKLLKTRSHRRNILRIVLEFFESCNINICCNECIQHNMCKIIIRVIAVKTIIWWCERKNAIINSDIHMDILHNELNNILKIKQMREYYKNKQFKRKQVLKEYRNLIKNRK